MPVLAVCPNCGKSYQAPDSMAGKSVRCKQCQTIFQIAPPENDPSQGSVDFDALSASVGGDEAIDSDAGTRIGPTVAADGKVSIRRARDVEAVRLRNEQAGGGLRSNLRFRYPGARQVDVGLPIALVVAALAVPFWLSLTSAADRFEGPPPQGAAASRYGLLLAVWVVLLIPAAHFSIRAAADALRFSLPRTPLWRSCAVAGGAMLIAAVLLFLSGGSLVGVILGLFAGTATAVAAGIVLFRVLPHEIGKFGLYLGGATFGALALAALLLFGLNAAALAITRNQADPTLFTSPIAIGAPWIAKPEAAPAPKPTPRAPTASAPAAVATGTTGGTPATVTPPPENSVADQFIPAPEDRKLLSRVEQLPVQAGFRSILLPRVAGPAVGVVRETGGGALEVWDSRTWKLLGEGRNFDAASSVMSLNPAGTQCVRLVTSPYLRLEAIALSNAKPLLNFVRLDTAAPRTLEGFVSDSVIAIRVGGDRAPVAYEQYDLANGGVQKSPTSGSPAAVTPLSLPDPSGTPRPISFNPVVCPPLYTPDGQLIVAGRDPGRNNRPVLARFSLDRPDKPEFVAEFPWDAADFVPAAMAVNDRGDVAVIMNINGEGWLTVWRLKDQQRDGAALPALPTPMVDMRLGLIKNTRPAQWAADREALIWLDADTLLLHGQRVIDGRSGNTLQTIQVRDVAAAMRESDGSVEYLIRSGPVPLLIRARFDLKAIDALRQRLAQ